MSSERKLFVSDFDQTLAMTDKSISPATQEALEEWCRRGNLFCLSTGRAMKDARNLAERLNLTNERFPGLYIIAFNGGEVYDCSNDEIIYHAGIRRDLIPDIFALAKETELYVQTYDDTHILAEREAPELAFYNTWCKLPHKIDADIMNLVKNDPAKCLAITQDHFERLPILRDKLMKAFPDDLNAFQSSEFLLEIVPAGVDKGVCLRNMAEKLGIPMENTIAAGDAPNDIPMIKAAGLGIVMKNGAAIYPEVDAAGREEGSVITDEDNDHDALVKFLI